MSHVEFGQWYTCILWPWKVGLLTKWLPWLDHVIEMEADSQDGLEQKKARKTKNDPAQNFVMAKIAKINLTCRGGPICCQGQGNSVWTQLLGKRKAVRVVTVWCLNLLSPLRWRTWPAWTLEPAWSSWGSAQTSVSSSSCWSWRGCHHCGIVNPGIMKYKTSTANTICLISVSFITLILLNVHFKRVYYVIMLIIFLSSSKLLPDLLNINHQHCNNVLCNIKCMSILWTEKYCSSCLLLQQSLHYYRKQQYVANWERSYDVRYEPCPQVTHSDLLDVQNRLLWTRAEQHIEQMDKNVVPHVPSPRV